VESADGRLAAFAAGVMPALRRYVPE
jgi:hypothetical protein